MAKSKIPRVDLERVPFVYRTTNRGGFEFDGVRYHYWRPVELGSLTWEQLEKINASGSWRVVASGKRVGYGGHLVQCQPGYLGISVQARSSAAFSDLIRFEDLLERYGLPN